MAEADGCEDCYGVTYFNRMVTEFFELVWSMPSSEFSTHLYLLSISIIHNYFIFPQGSQRSEKSRDLEGAACLFLVQPKKYSDVTVPWSYFAVSYNSNVLFLMKFEEMLHKWILNSFPRGMEGVLWLPTAFLFWGVNSGIMW